MLPRGIGKEMEILSRFNSSEKISGKNKGRMAARRAMKIPHATRMERVDECEVEEEAVTYDLLRSCFFLCRSSILTISRRPELALTLTSRRSMLIFS